MYKKYVLIILAIIGLACAPLFHTMNAQAATGKPEFGFSIGLDIKPTMTAAAYETSLQTFKRDIDTLVEHKQTWARFGIPAWAVARYDSATQSIQPQVTDDEQAVQAISYYMSAINYVKQSGLKLYLILTDTVGLEQDTQAEYTAHATAYWRFIANHVGTKANVIQIYNQAQSDHYRFYSHVADDQLPAYWAEMNTMLGIARTVFKTANPQVQMTTNCFGYPVTDDIEQRWLAYFDAIKDNLDIITFNLYPDSQEQIDSLAKRVANAKSRYNKPVMVGEVGRQGFKDSHGDASRSFEGQADNVSKYLDALRASDVDAVMVYELRDNGPNDEDGEQNFGILEYNGDKKPSFDPIMYAARPVIVADQTPDTPDTTNPTDNTQTNSQTTTSTKKTPVIPGVPNTGTVTTR